MQTLPFLTEGNACISPTIVTCFHPRGLDVMLIEHRLLTVKTSSVLNLKDGNLSLHRS